jgi:pyruvate/2-oxoglutarate/acetoin dehydrogenase E1 component/TPP-dependent pyruvate/acetoin dehydrogenase alpha subunit
MVLADFKLACQSRQLSILARKEVLNGKAKFAIMGDGKEIAQIAYARMFRNGDWRSGYYRDQTFMLAAGLTSLVEMFSQVYGTTSPDDNPGNGGRVMNNHFSTPNSGPDGNLLNLMQLKNSAADLSPTAGQIPRLLGLALASKLFRINSDFYGYTSLTDKGNEVAFGSIGDSSTSEGHFFEVMNAAGILQVPLAMAVWDDGYGISVPTRYQTTKANIALAMKGFEKKNDATGILIFEGKGWDYPGLCSMFEKGITRCRNEHVPVLFHVSELTQPLGHSTSGSHERYKSPERLEWEKQYDCIQKMREWLTEKGIATAGELDQLELQAAEDVRMARDAAWEKYQRPIREERDALLQIVKNRSCLCRNDNLDKIRIITGNLEGIENPVRKDILSTARKLLRYICFDCSQRESLREQLLVLQHTQRRQGFEKYSAFLYNETERSAINVAGVEPVFGSDSPWVPGREIIRDNFDVLFAKYPLLLAFGEDVGKIGGVNQTYEGLQAKYGSHRIFDTGIRELSIIGKGIGLALRGFRPIAEIQYFDYLLYALQTISDDLASAHWRTMGGQSIPLIISTRGHRLEGVWHSGSPLSMVINSIRGVYVCVPRNMTQAAGFYNTLLEGMDPALVIEPLYGYRLKERRPENTGEYRIPLGVPEIMEEGTDITLVTYGACVKIAQDACRQLEEFGISVELIDVQTLLPFDINETIVESLKKTNRVLFFDEDVPGGATAYMMQKVLEEQGGYHYLDTAPRTLTGMEHRPAYGTDGDYFSNPSAENVFETVYDIMHEADPDRFPGF